MEEAKVEKIENLVRLVRSGLEKSGNNKRLSPSLRWCFTWNMYDFSTKKAVLSEKQKDSVLIQDGEYKVDSRFARFREMLDNPEMVQKYTFQEEIGEAGNFHMQGVVWLKKRKRASQFFGIKPIRWSKTKDWLASVFYCSDVKKRAPGGRMWSVPKAPRRVVKMTYDELRAGQQKIADYFAGEPPRFGRKIHWFWETKGNWGKSILCQYLIDERGALVVQGANKDILCGLAAWIAKNGEGPEVIVFDVPRTNKGHVSYQAIESLLNGFCFSGKYESGMLRFNPPHVCVFANEEPDYSSCSADRWVVEELTSAGDCDKSISSDQGSCAHSGLRPPRLHRQVAQSGAGGPAGAGYEMNYDDYEMDSEDPFC